MKRKSPLTRAKFSVSLFFQFFNLFRHWTAITVLCDLCITLP